MDMETPPEAGVEEPQLEDAPSPEEQEAWAVSREDWERTQQFMDTVGPFVAGLAQEIQMAREAQMAAMQAQQSQQPYGQQPQPGQQAPEWDPFEPETVQRHIDQRVQQATQEAIAQAFGPYENVMATVATERGEHLANEVLDEVEAQAGEFNRDVAVMLAAPLVEAGTDPVHALRACAGFAQQFEREIRMSEREKMKEELQNLRGSSETSSYASGGAEEMEKVPTGKDRYEEAVRRALARRRPVNPVG